jgi:2-methylisocitrate lyase-like PEP mutase family enzyme
MAHDRAAAFLALHQPGKPLLMPNPWDLGSARLLESAGFQALATTSSGFAATLGRRDGGVTCDEVLAHATALSAAVSVPVSADFENGFADDPAGVAENVRRATQTGLAGCSVEDYAGRAGIYDRALAVERVEAAAEAAHSGPERLVLTARAENHIRGRDDLPDTIARLQAYCDAGADVVFAPGLTKIDDIRAIVSSVDAPVNVLAGAVTPPVAALAEAGVARISVGGSFLYTALGAVVAAARELLDHGTYGYWDTALPGMQAARAAFPAPES